MFIMNEKLKAFTHSCKVFRSRLLRALHSQLHRKTFANQVSRVSLAHSYAFTLTEVIIVLVILGALALVLVPNLSKMMPDDHNIKYKKAFYTIQEIVNDIVNDPNTCQGMNASVEDGKVVYSSMGTNRTNNILTTCADIDGTTITDRYLDKEICERLSTQSNCGDTGSNTNVLTTNGMRWNLPSQNLRRVNNIGFTSTIYVDVDGGNDAPEKARNASKGVYRIQVKANGKVIAPSTNESDEDTNKTEEQLLLDNPTD